MPSSMSSPGDSNIERWGKSMRSASTKLNTPTVDLDVTRLPWVGKERTVESFRGFFTVIGEEVASKIVSSARTCGSRI
jgi:hypothetical protein